MKHTRRNILKQASALSALAVGASATASAADCSSESDWDSSETYQGGDTAVYNNTLYEASWWTRGDEPGSSQWGPWEEVGPCDGGGDDDDDDDGGMGACSGVSAWDSSATYTGGDQAVYDGALYEASWWTQGDEPGSSEWGPWDMVEECSSGDGDATMGSLSFNDQALSSDGAVTVSDVSTDGAATVVVTYADGDMNIVAGVAAADSASGMAVSVTIEDAGGFPGEHTAWVFADSAVEGVAIGDDATPVAGDAFDSASAMVSEASEPDPPDEDFKVIGYYPGWKANPDQDYYPEDVPFEKLTHMLYAFLGVEADGSLRMTTETEFDSEGQSDEKNLQQFADMADKAEENGCKLILSIGGWTMSDNFSPMAADESTRQAFADNCVELMREYNFHGIDIDWEHPGPDQGQEGTEGSDADYENHALLMEDLRERLDKAGEEDGQYYHLSIANGGSDWNAAGLKHDRLGEACDAVMIMAYDFTGSWMPQHVGMGLNAPIYGPTDKNPQDDRDAYPSHSGGDAQYYLEYSVDLLYAGDHGQYEPYVPGQPGYSEPADYDELVLGLPFYGRGFEGVSYADPGYGQPYNGLPEGTWHDLLEDGSDPTGAFDFWDLKENYIGEDGWEVEYHDPGEVPMLTNDEEGIYISYDDEQSIAEKVNFAKDRGMGGVMFWELSQDDEMLLDTILENI
ncbi:glycosyl hydrolase family 18 protein [Halovenus marina]|uniref:glycosyl hydrolase family 18 protein n=1 Tax=Halovenus marina TaxID=3396621 RepID=UPI003F54357E